MRQPGDAVDRGVCPACGLIFAKWVDRENFVPPSLRQRQDTDSLEDTPAGWSAIGSRLLEVPDKVDPVSFWGRVTVFVLLLIWSYRLVNYDITEGEIAGSFMHNIILPIHEAGHILFIPFGEFMTIAGGSLFQLLLPLIAAGTLLIQNRDPFGAGLGLWWCGTSLVDLAPYIYDAAVPTMMLLGGHTGEDGPHDWIYLLDHFGKVTRSPVYGHWAHTLGVLVMLAGLGWAALILWRQKARLADSSAPDLPL